MANLLEFTTLFVTLALCACTITALAALLSHSLMSVWLIVFTLSFLLVWMILENFSIYQDLRAKQRPIEDMQATEKMHLCTINALVLQAHQNGYASKANEQMLNAHICDLDREIKTLRNELTVCHAVQPKPNAARGPKAKNSTTLRRGHSLVDL